MYGMINWFARNEVAANLLMMVILVAGVWSLSQRIPLEVFPTFERDVVNISISYRGATPKEVEEAVVVRVEEAIADLEGIEQINSYANEGSGHISVDVEDGHDPREMLDDIKNRVDAIIGFPTDVERPLCSVQIHRHEVISVAVSADLPEKQLRELGERVRDDIAALPEVSLVELAGIRPYEMTLEISEQVLDSYGLTFDQVVTAVRGSSLDQPAGTIKTRNGEILLRTSGQSYRGEDFARIGIVTRPDGTRITLADIATIKDGFEEDPLYAEFDGRPAVMVEVFRTGQQSALDVAAAVRDYVAEQGELMPDGVTLNYWRDRSHVVKLRLQTLLNSAWQGGILVFLCLALFLRLSVALWVCVGIPISFAGALMLMPEMGTTINLISLFAFILVLGIVVDDAIITGENIYSHLKRGAYGIEAAVRGAQEVAVPVTFGLLTTLAAFLPLMFIEGRRGPLFAQIPMIVIPVLIFSWVESKLILPAHLSHVHVNNQSSINWLLRLQASIADNLEKLIRFFYGPILRLALNWRYATIALFVGVSFLVLSFVLSGRYGFTFFPRVQSEIAQATLTMQTGSSALQTQQEMARIAGAAEQLKEKYTDPATGESVVRHILNQVGWSNMPTASGNPEKGQVSLELVPPEERTLVVTTSKLVTEWRQAIGLIPGARELNYRAELGRTGSPIDVQLSGQDFLVLKQVIDDLRLRLSEYPGVFDIQDTFEDGKPEIVLMIRPESELLGLNSADLGRQVRQAFFGAEVQRVQRGRDDMRVMVKYPQAERSSVASLENMRIRTASGQDIPISSVADIRLGQGFATIRRVDRQRTVNVQADIDKERVDINQITADLTDYLNDIKRRHPGLRFTFEGEQREQRESFGSMMLGSGLILFCIYTLLAIPLRSYLQPFVVMIVIPFSVVGAILGHMVLGINLSVMSVMGMMALAGVVVNDSLVLVHWINRRLEEGLSLHETVYRAGMVRLRPILLTSITTFAGLAPLIWDQSTQAQFLIPMAVSLGFGILYATLLSLLLVPVCYLVLNDLLSILGNPDPADPVTMTEQP